MLEAGLLGKQGWKNAHLSRTCPALLVGYIITWSNDNLLSAAIGFHSSAAMAQPLLTDAGSPEGGTAVLDEMKCYLLRFVTKVLVTGDKTHILIPFFLRRSNQDQSRSQ